MERWKVLLIGAAFFVAMGIVGTMDKQDAEAERERYCEMVQMHHDTGGEYGWPPYKGECK